MIGPDDILVMNEQEKLELLSRLADGEGWSGTFEPVYLKLAEDESPKVRAAAIVALWDLASPEHIDMLMSKAESDPDTTVRGKAASVLGVYIYEGDIEELDEARFLHVRRFLLDLAQDPDEELLVRRMAIEALSFGNDEEVHDLIAWAYEHPNTEMKLSAVFAMGRSGAPRWHQIILEELKSADRQIKLEAINAANESGLQAATPALRNLVASRDKDIAIAAIYALSHTRGPGALETLEMCALAEDDEVRRSAEDALDEFLGTPPDPGDFGDFGDDLEEDD